MNSFNPSLHLPTPSSESLTSFTQTDATIIPNIRSEGAPSITSIAQDRDPQSLRGRLSMRLSHPFHENRVVFYTTLLACFILGGLFIGASFIHGESEQTVKALALTGGGFLALGIFRIITSH